MWWAWINIAVRHELEARDHIGTFTDPSVALGTEFAASLVAVTASAIAVEALYGELKYLVPRRTSTKENVRTSSTRRFETLLHSPSVSTNPISSVSVRS